MACWPPHSWAARGASSSGEVELALALANQAALAGASARLQEGMQPRLLELSVISRVARTLNQVAGLSQLCDSLVTEIGGALGAASIVLAIYDAASDALSFPLVLEDGQRLSASPRAPGGLLAHVIQKRASLLLAGPLEAQLEQLGLTYEPLVAGGAVPCSYLAVPLILGSRVIGALAVADQARAGHFNQSSRIHPQHPGGAPRGRHRLPALTG